MKDLLYIEKVPASIRPQFEQKVRSIAAYLGTNPDFLMLVMWAESRLNPYAQNKSKKDGHLIAAGLLQFTKASGITGAPASVLQKGYLEQLDLVKTYFKPYAGRLNTYFDVYLVTFFPAAIGKPDSYVFKTDKYSPALIANQNPIIDKDKNAIITMAEFKAYVKSTVPKNLLAVIFSNPIISIAAIFTIGILFFLIYKK